MAARPSIRALTRVSRRVLDYAEVHRADNVQKFERSLADRSYGHNIKTYAVEANEKLIFIFEGHEDLSDHDVLSRAVILYERRRWSPWFVCEVAGNLMGWGLHLGIIETRDARDGSRGWTMPDREMRFAVIGGRAIQVRGLEPEAQARMDRNRRATAKRNATLQRNHTIKIGVEVQRHLAEIIRLDPDTLIPKMAIRSQGYIPDDIEKRWPRLAEASGLLIDIHHAWSRNRQKWWVYHLRQEVKAAEGRRSIRERDAKAQQEHFDEDAEAFGNMEDF